MNAYFASVEENCNPALRGRPVAVCGEGRTVIVTANYPAREFGIKTGMTPFEAKKLCPSVNVVYGNLDKYIDTAGKIHKILLEYTDRVEVFSIDECFVDISKPLEERNLSPETLGTEIKNRIKTGLGLTCSVGIAKNKFLAKLASDMKKPDGLTVVKEEEITKLFSDMPVEKICGIGERMRRRLSTIGIITVRQLGEASLSVLLANFGITGYLLKEMGQGRGDSYVRPYDAKEEIKSVGHSYTLPEDSSNPDVLKGYLLWLSMRVAKRMREYRMKAKTVSIVIRYSGFHTVAKRHTAGSYLATAAEIYRLVMEVFRQLYIRGSSVRLLGVTAGNLVRDSGEDDLFDNFSNKIKLEKTVDEINAGFGDLTIRPLSVLFAERFGMLKKCGLLGHRF